MNKLKNFFLSFTLILSKTVKLFDPVLYFFESLISLITYSFDFLTNKIFKYIPKIKGISIGNLIVSSLTSYLLVYTFNIFAVLFDFSLGIVNFAIFSVLAIVLYFLELKIIFFIFGLLDLLIGALSLGLRLVVYLPFNPKVQIFRIVFEILLVLSLISLNLLGFINVDLALFFILIIASHIILTLLIVTFTKDYNINYLGYLKDLTIEKISVYNKSIGLYFMIYKNIPLYIGRAIEFDNGGLRKRLSDYVRDSSSGRKHKSGRFINANKDKIKLFVIKMGESEANVGWVKEAETRLIQAVNTKINVMNKLNNKIINIIGYVLGFAIFNLISRNINYPFIPTIINVIGLINLAILVVRTLFIKKTETV